MNRVHVVGHRNHGKTTLVADLVAELTRLGKRVGTVKHSSHSHELDTPGKDSFVHRQAGANPAAIITADLVAVYQKRPPDAYAELAPVFRDTDLVLVEGDVGSAGPSIEVYRACMGETPLADARDQIVAVVSDDVVQTRAPLWPRSDVGALAERVMRLVALR